MLWACRAEVRRMRPRSRYERLKRLAKLGRSLQILRGPRRATETGDTRCGFPGRVGFVVPWHDSSRRVLPGARYGVGGVALRRHGLGHHDALFFPHGLAYSAEG